MSYPDWQTIRNTNYNRSRYYPMLDVDTPTFMGRRHAISPADLKGADVVIIGSRYVAGWGDYMGFEKSEWSTAARGIRQQSIRYASGYIQELDLDILDACTIVDYGDADLPPESVAKPTVDNILRAQRNVELKVAEVLEAGAVPIVIGANSPCASYAVAKPIAERTTGSVGMVKLDTHWDVQDFDRLTMDPRIAGSGNWVRKLYEWHPNMRVSNHVEIGERGPWDSKEHVREWVGRGTHFYPMWKIRTELGIEGLCSELHHAYEGTEAVYVHFDVDVLGGAGPTDGDILGELAEPIGMTDFEAIRIAYEVGKLGVTGASFVAIPPNSAIYYRAVVYMIMYMIAGICQRRGSQLSDAGR